MSVQNQIFVCKVLYPCVAVLYRQLFMTAFFCGRRIPLPKQHCALTLYHDRALWDPGLKTSVTYHSIQPEVQENIFSHLNETDLLLEFSRLLKGNSKPLITMFWFFCLFVCLKVTTVSQKVKYTHTKKHLQISCHTKINHFFYTWGAKCCSTRQPRQTIKISEFGPQHVFLCNKASKGHAHKDVSI